MAFAICSWAIRSAGRPDDENCYVNGVVDYEKVKATQFYADGINRLQTAFSQQQHVALMCSEGKPEECHRSKLIGVTLTYGEILVIHIDENDTLQSQAEIIKRLTGGQLLPIWWTHIPLAQAIPSE